MKAEDFVIKAKRAPKDPNAPKRVKSAYMCFAAKCRAELVKESPGLSFGEVGREAGKRWQALSEKQKEPWLKTVSDDKERYEEEMRTYVPDEAYAAQKQKLKAQGPKLAKDPDKPKRGRTAYLVFCDSKRAAIRKKHPKQSMLEVMATLAEQWNSISANERNQCDKTAEKEKAEYQTALASYEPSDEYKQAMELVAATTAKKAKKAKEAKEAKKAEKAKQAKKAKKAKKAKRAKKKKKKKKKKKTQKKTLSIAEELSKELDLPLELVTATMAKQAKKAKKAQQNKMAKKADKVQGKKKKTPKKTLSIAEELSRKEALVVRRRRASRQRTRDTGRLRKGHRDEDTER
jgi:hypothetical protein